MVIFQHENQTQRPANAASEWFIHYYFRNKECLMSFLAKMIINFFAAL